MDATQEGEKTNDDKSSTQRKQFLRNAYWGFARSYDEKKQYQEAAKYWELASQQQAGPPMVFFRIWRARSLMLDNMHDHGLALLESLGNTNQMPLNFQYDFAAAAAAGFPPSVEAKALALATLEQLAETNYFEQIQSGDYIPPKKRADFDGLRDEPAFVNLLEKLERQNETLSN